MAKELNVGGRMKVKTLKKDFNDIFGVEIKVYKTTTTGKGAKAADGDATLASIRGEGAKGGEISLHGRTKVGNVEKMFKDEMGIGIQILDKEGKLADNSISLSQASKE